MVAPKLTKSEYLLSAAQSELEEVEMRCLAKAANLGADLQDLAHALGLGKQFAALFRQKLFAEAFKDMIQALAEASLSRTLIEARRTAPKRIEAEAAFETLDKLTQERAEEVLSESNPTHFLEPDLQPQTLIKAIMARQTVWDRRKHAVYFATWGCRGCQRKDITHAWGGYCGVCGERLHNRYHALQKKWDKEHPIEQLGIDPKVEAVKRLLGRLGSVK